jgi:hypothetical protein
MEQFRRWLIESRAAGVILSLTWILFVALGLWRFSLGGFERIEALLSTALITCGFLFMQLLRLNAGEAAFRLLWWLTLLIGIALGGRIIWTFFVLSEFAR